MPKTKTAGHLEVSLRSECSGCDYLTRVLEQRLTCHIRPGPPTIEIVRAKLHFDCLVPTVAYRSNFSIVCNAGLFICFMVDLAHEVVDVLLPMLLLIKLHQIGIGIECNVIVRRNL